MIFLIGWLLAYWPFQWNPLVTPPVAVPMPTRHPPPTPRPTLTAAEAAAEKVTIESRAAKDASDMIGARKLYGKLLREKYLNDHMDIVVTVSGKASDQIKLSYVLFNAVWVHEFGKGDMPRELRDYGFKTVTITDGYNFAMAFDLK